MSKMFQSMDGCQAAAYVSYAFTEVAGIYPITGKTIALTRRTFVGKVVSAFEYAIQVGHNFSFQGVNVF